MNNPSEIPRAKEDLGNLVWAITYKADLLDYAIISEPCVLKTNSRRPKSMVPSGFLAERVDCDESLDESTVGMF